MVKAEIRNLDEIKRGLREFTKDVDRATDRALTETGRFVEAEAKKRCPIGPTKSAASGTDYHYDPKKAPGTLRASIIMLKGGHYVDVGVLRGPAMQYANIIHNERGTRWKKLGPGNVGGTARIGDKFLDRAYDENERTITDFFVRSTDKSVERFNKG